MDLVPTFLHPKHKSLKICVAIDIPVDELDRRVVQNVDRRVALYDRYGRRAMVRLRRRVASEIHATHCICETVRVL